MSVSEAALSAGGVGYRLYAGGVDRAATRISPAAPREHLCGCATSSFTHTHKEVPAKRGFPAPCVGVRVHSHVLEKWE
jgi:hypothetical protein